MTDHIQQAAQACAQALRERSIQKDDSEIIAKYMDKFALDVLAARDDKWAPRYKALETERDKLLEVVESLLARIKELEAERDRLLGRNQPVNRCGACGYLLSDHSYTGACPRIDLVYAETKGE